MQPTKILISACLLGENVRYDGKNKLLDHPIIRCWSEENRLISICPEVAGGLSIPRPAAEIQASQKGRILVTNVTGRDVSTEFEIGAQKTLELCLKNNIQIAVLTDGSPSCGRKSIYDGKFSSVKISGMGITTKLLMQNAIHVFTEYQLEKAHDLYLCLRKT